MKIPDTDKAMKILKLLEELIDDKNWETFHQLTIKLAISVVDNT